MRESVGLSQREIERRLGWKSGRLSVIERGLVPSTEDADRLRTCLVAAMLEKTVGEIA
jgi:transcriptional regulator with XRE-family HTH domain